MTVLELCTADLSTAGMTCDTNEFERQIMSRHIPE